jgi:transposase
MYPPPSTTHRAVLLRDKPGEDPASEHLFVFGNAARNRMKIFFSDASGIWVCGKRHARDRFRWTRDQAGGFLIANTGIQLYS